MRAAVAAQRWRRPAAAEDSSRRKLRRHLVKCAAAGVILENCEALCALSCLRSAGNRSRKAGCHPGLFRDEVFKDGLLLAR